MTTLHPEERREPGDYLLFDVPRNGRSGGMKKVLVQLGVPKRHGPGRTRAMSATELVEPRLYRKAPLFDRFVKFDVQVEGPEIRR